MTIDRKKKESIIDILKDKIKKSTGFILIDYSNTDVSKIQSLRNHLREDGNLMIAKNSLIYIAITQSNIPIDTQLSNKIFSGQQAILFAYKDILSVQNKLRSFLGSNSKILTIKHLFADNEYIEDKNSVLKYSSKIDIYSNILNSFYGILYKLHYNLSATQHRLRYDLEQIINKEK